MTGLPPPDLPDWLARELPFDRYVVPVGGQRMHVMEIGEGRPVLCLHGNPTWGFLWRRVVFALHGEPLRLILPDLIGLGFSSKVTDPSLHSLENHAAWVRGLIRTLDLQDLILAVHDWGGAIGVGAIREEAGRLAGLVVLNTALSEPKPNFKPTLFHRMSHLPVVSDLLFRVLGFPQTMLWMAQGDKGSIRGTVARAYRYPLRDLRKNVAPLALARMVPDSMEHPSIPELKRCRQFVEEYEGPAAIVWGDNDPILGSVRSWIQKLLPRATMRRTEGGHFLQEEVPGPIADAIREVARRSGS